MEDSHFGRLPAEIRNDIYHRLLTPPEGIVTLMDIANEGDASSIRLPTPASVLALAHTCKQIRAETKGYTFTENKFRFIFSKKAPYHPEYRLQLERWFVKMVSQGLIPIADLKYGIENGEEVTPRRESIDQDLQTLSGRATSKDTVELSITFKRILNQKNLYRVDELPVLVDRGHDVWGAINRIRVAYKRHLEAGFFKGTLPCSRWRYCDLLEDLREAGDEFDFFVIRLNGLFYFLGGCFAC